MTPHTVEVEAYLVSISLHSRFLVLSPVPQVREHCVHSLRVNENEISSFFCAKIQNHFLPTHLTTLWAQGTGSHCTSSRPSQARGRGSPERGSSLRGSRTSDAGPSRLRRRSGCTRPTRPTLSKLRVREVFNFPSNILICLCCSQYVPFSNAQHGAVNGVALVRGNSNEFHGHKMGDATIFVHGSYSTL